MPDHVTPARPDRALRAAYRHCRRTVRRQDPVEYAIMQLTPPALRPAWWAMWAAFSSADDIADDPRLTPGERAEQLQAWLARLDDDLARGHSDDPVRHALVDTVHRLGVDLDAVRGSFETLSEDTRGRTFATWPEWSSWVRQGNHGWAAAGLPLLTRAGIHIPLWLNRTESYQRYLDGLYLTDTLADLHHDLSRGDLLLPAEVLQEFPGAADALHERRHTPAVKALTSHLTGQARQWLCQPDLLTGLPPGPAVVFQAATRLFLARLDSIDTAGPALLQRVPLPGRATRWRLLAPARAQAGLAWRLLSPTSLSTSAGPAPERGRAVTEAGPVEPPPPHPGGARPPAVAGEVMPRHVAVIMDGNGRWATQRGLPRSAGHHEGFTTAVSEAVYGALEIGLPYLTLYAFSTENWKRPTEEISELFRICRDELRREHTARRHGVRIRWAGLPDGLPEDLTDEILQVQDDTRHETRLTLTFCLNYGGRTELTRAARTLAHQAAAGTLDPDTITDSCLAAHLLLPDQPDVDLLWRTGGEQRISNFLLWHAAYAELHFTDTLWPDTDRRDLWQAITAYTHRQRRYGNAPSVPAQTRGVTSVSAQPDPS